MRKKIMLRRALFFNVLAAGIFISGCGRGNTVLARVDNTVVTEKDFEKRISALPERYQELIDENRRKFLDEVIVDTLLYNEANKRKLYNNKEVKEVIAEAKKKILIAKYLKDNIEKTKAVSDSDAEEYYKAHQDEFVTPEIRRASHILVKNEKDAAGILQELENNRNFEDLARSRSEDQTAEKGGDIGYFVKGQLDPDFEKACFQLKEGAISEVVKTRFGYHIIKLTEIRSPGVAAFAEVKENIKQNMLREAQKQRFNELVARLKDEAKIIVNESSKIFKEKKPNK